MLQYITHVKYKILLMNVMLHEYTRMHTHMQFSLMQFSDALLAAKPTLQSQSYTSTYINTVKKTRK